jgi:hypothetical protein
MRTKTEEVIFGILSGVGAILMAFLLSIIIAFIIPGLYSYSIIIFFVLYIALLLLTAILYAKGLFRKVYLISTVIIFLLLYYFITQVGYYQ